MKRCHLFFLVLMIVSLVSTSAWATFLIHVDTDVNCDTWVVGGVVDPSSALPLDTPMTYSVTASQDGHVLFYQGGDWPFDPPQSYGWPFLIVGTWGGLVFDGQIDVEIHLYVDDPVYDDIDHYINLQIECEDPLPYDAQSWHAVKSLYR